MEFYIPVIDLSEPYDVICSKVKYACENVGFLTLKNHGIDDTKLFEISQNFFKLPNEEKMFLARNKWNSDNPNEYRGYFPSSVYGKEGLDLADPLLTNTELEKNRYPISWNKNVIDSIDDYFDILHTLGYFLYGIVNENSDNKLKRPDCMSTLRFNYYPGGIKPVEISGKQQLSCEEHFDSGLFTILFIDSYGGLEIQNPKDGIWHKVPYVKNHLIVNTGKALEIISNGKYPATNHRVTYCEDKRISIPFFFEPSNNYMIGKYTYKEYLDNRCKIFKEYEKV